MFDLKRREHLGLTAVNEPEFIAFYFPANIHPSIIYIAYPQVVMGSWCSSPAVILKEAGHTLDGSSVH